MRAAIAALLASLLASLPVRAQAPARAPAAPPPAYDAPAPQPTPPAAPAPAPPAAPPPPLIAPAAPPLRALPPPPAAVAPDGVYVEIRSSSPGVRIDRVVGQGLQVPVCVAPCRQVLPRNNVYIVDGDGMRSSSRFMLPDDRDQLTLDVDAGSTARLGGGVLLAIVGFGVAFGGLVALGANTVAGNDQGVSAALLVGGLAAGIFGVYLTSTSHTTVVSSTGAVFTRAPPRPRGKRPPVALTRRGLEF